MAPRTSAASRTLPLFAADPAPKTRGDCLPGGAFEARPCPFVACRYYLPHVHPDQTETCALDVADEGSHELQAIGDLMGITRERVRQIEEEAFVSLRRKDKRLGTLKELSTHDGSAEGYFADEDPAT